MPGTTKLIGEDETPTARAIRLIREDERERCAKVVESFPYDARMQTTPALLMIIADVIRGLGEPALSSGQGEA